MPLEADEVQQNPAVLAFIAELRHWREVAGFSQKALAKLVGYTPSYVNKVEHGTVLASRAFAESADQHLHAGRALIRRWKDMHDALVEMSADKPRHDEHRLMIRSRLPGRIWWSSTNLPSWRSGTACTRRESGGSCGTPAPSR